VWQKMKNMQKICTVHDFMTFYLLSPGVISWVISRHKISREEYPAAFADF
jgi:hypothetical protein